MQSNVLWNRLRELNRACAGHFRCEVHLEDARWMGSVDYLKAEVRAVAFGQVFTCGYTYTQEAARGMPNRVALNFAACVYDVTRAIETLAEAQP